MDSFDIDMELLRRIGEVRSTVQALDEDHEAGGRALESAVTALKDHAGENDPDLARLLRLFHDGLGTLDPQEISPVSRFATGAITVCEALEQYLISLDSPAAPQIMEQAASTLLLALNFGTVWWIQKLSFPKGRKLRSA